MTTPRITGEASRTSRLTPGASRDINDTGFLAHVHSDGAERTPMVEQGSSHDDLVIPDVVAASAAKFERVGLEAAISVGLLDRIDTKVVGSIDQIAAVLDAISDQFQLVEVVGSVAPAYRSVYFDTALHELYNDHHNGRRVRHKIRYRTYVSTDTTFFEVKLRTDSRRTVKHRIRVPWIPHELGQPELDLLEQHNVPTPGALPTLDIEYNRLTLVGPAERVTIDLGLTCTAEEAWVRFDRTAIIEVKQPRFNLSSPVFRAMRDQGLRPGGISKYCVGMATCVPGVKTNKFKSRLRMLGNVELTP